MARQKLTAGRIRELECPEMGQAFLWDSEVPGLGIRATPGNKVFIFQGRLGLKTVRIKIGDVRTWAIDSNEPALLCARQEARRLKSLMDSGIDPRNEKKERIAEEQIKREQLERAESLFSDVWSEYLNARKSKWSDRHYKDHVSMADPGGMPYKNGKGTTKPGAMAELMSLKLSDLTQERIETW